jgi:ADP-dependent NAD(P)H-hydrate dehydratase / NAD(P)H-hydrate epimerase
MSLEHISFQNTLPLFNAAATRQIEAAAALSLPSHTLMQRAGLSVARLACAIAPHARVMWLACGPGNNGGDGLEAAMHLQMWGREPIVTWLGDEASCPPDALASYHRARDAGVQFADTPPAQWDVALDALLGVGASRAPQGVMLQWLKAMHQSAAPVLQVDMPSGLDADTGAWSVFVDSEKTPELIANYSNLAGGEAIFSLKKYTLSLLTLKTGLLTTQGRDACGEIWFDDLGIVHMDTGADAPSAWLSGAAQMVLPARAHASHKGSYGDVAVIGGAVGMQGAALLAARAALHAGAGRVFVGLLGGGLTVDAQQPELMFRDLSALELEGKTVVCGCGGGDAVRKVLARVLSASSALVLDADALNAMAVDASLQVLLQARAPRGLPTILTPHPLEAARLLGISAAQVQAHRLQAAQSLADRFACTVILKGSGSVVASPDQIPAINPTGDARLATAGTGDVLAGLCGAFLAQMVQQAIPVQHSTMLAAQQACWWHGKLLPPEAKAGVLPASDLLQGWNQLSW